MAKVELRKIGLSDAKRMLEILNNPHFKYFTVRPKSIKAQEKWIKKSFKQRKENFAHHFVTLYCGKVVGGCGIKINQHRKHIGEIGYFLDEAYWNKGITTKAVRKPEQIGFGKLKLDRIEIVMNPKNKASEKVAIKCGYKKEGLMKKFIKQKNKYSAVWMYAKTR